MDQPSRTLGTNVPYLHGEGNSLWQPGLKASVPDTILGIQVIESEYMSNTFESGKYVGLLGDLSQYWIVENLAIQVQVVTELYAETNQNGYIARASLDGMAVDELAFVRVTLG